MQIKITTNKSFPFIQNLYIHLTLYLSNPIFVTFFFFFNKKKMLWYLPKNPIFVTKIFFIPRFTSHYQSFLIKIKFLLKILSSRLFLTSLTISFIHCFLLILIIILTLRYTNKNWCLKNNFRLKKKKRKQSLFQPTLKVSIPRIGRIHNAFP